MESFNFNEKVRYLINNNFLAIITNIVNSPVSKNRKAVNELFEIGAVWYWYFWFFWIQIKKL